MGRLASLKPRVAVVDTRRAAPAPKLTDPIYGTAAWKRAREECILRSGFRCANCGALTERLIADHIVELKDGGAPFDQANLQALCTQCNTAKGVAERARRQAAQPPRPNEGGG